MISIIIDLNLHYYPAAYMLMHQHLEYHTTRKESLTAPRIHMMMIMFMDL